MYRGTTPTLYFQINNIDDLSIIKDIWITIRSKERILLNKTLQNEEVVIDNNQKLVSVFLSQKETLGLNVKEVKVQMKVLFSDGTVSVSQIFTMHVDDILNQQEMFIN